MLKLRKTAVTGSISSGKSSVCQILKGMGAYIVSADQITHQLLEKDPVILESIRQKFGDKVFVNGAIDRSKLAEAVFPRPNKLRELEALLHPKVRLIIEEHYQQAVKDGKSTLFVAEIPLLFESDQENTFDTVIAIDAPIEIRMKRSSLNKEDFMRREKRQTPPEAKRSRAHFVINNDKDFAHLENQVESLYRTLTYPNPAQGD